MTTAGLRVAAGLELPREIVVEKNAILAMSGAGKSNAAVVLAEAMYDAGLPWVAVDPKGDWWGVRAARDGKGAGLQVPVFGGLHGDLPLDPSSGALVANLIIDKRLTCVLDVSEFDTRQDLFHFLTDFAETLLKRNTQPLHVFAEEADEYLPQQPGAKGWLPKCLGAWQRLVKRGRYRGIGSTLITQRSSAINKDVLNMTDTLVVMRTTAPLDRKAITGWVGAHGGDGALVESLPTLADGEAWVWSPQKLKLTQRVKFNRRRTFDSGATPLLDEKAAKVATLADIDLDALKDQMAETIARVRADDPELLRARIRELERELKARPAEQITERIEVPVEVEVRVPMVPDDLAAIIAAAFDGIGDDVEARKATLAERLHAYHIDPTPLPAPPRPTPVPVARRTTPAPERAPSRPTAAPSADGTALSKQAAKMLAVLAGRHPATITVAQLATLSGYSRRSSSWAPAFRELTAGGLAHLDRKDVTATDAGIDVVGTDIAAPQSGRDILEMWAARIGAQPRAFLLALVEHGTLTRDELAERTGYSRTSSSFGASITALRKNSLIVVDGDQISIDRDFHQAIQ